MKELPYTADVSHCFGARKRICTRCYRYLLMKMWERKSVEEQEPIIVFPAQAGKTTCRIFLDVEKQLKKRS